MSQPMFRSWVWDDHRLVARPDNGGELTALLAQRPRALAVSEVRRSHAVRLADNDALGVDHYAVEDLGSDSEQPRLDVVGDNVIVLTRTVRLDPSDMDLVRRPLGLLLTERLLVVVEDDAEVGMFTNVIDDACPLLSDYGTAGVLHAVLDNVVDGYGAALSTLETGADALADALFDQRPLDRDQQVQAFQLRRALAVLLRIVEPMRDVTTSLAKAAAHSAGDEDHSNDPIAALIPAGTARRFDDIADHVAHAVDLADSQREVLSSLYDTSLSLADVRLNTVMKKLSAWAAIIAVPTLITGFMGMNVPYPGYNAPAGVVAAIVVMLVAAVTLYVTFKRNDWL